MTLGVDLSSRCRGAWRGQVDPGLGAAAPVGSERGRYEGTAPVCSELPAAAVLLAERLVRWYALRAGRAWLGGPGIQRHGARTWNGHSLRLRLFVRKLCSAARDPRFLASSSALAQEEGRSAGTVIAF